MTTAIISHPDCLLHDMKHSIPEVPARIAVIAEALKNLPNLTYYQAPLATQEQLNKAHDPEYVQNIFQSVPVKGLVSLDPDTWLNPYSVQAALRAAGAAILGVDLLMKNEVSSVFCNIRPPGHHAEHATAMGFCIFNNCAVAVLHALEHHHLQRIAIIDFDVHHGNGTEDIFKNDQRVLLCSSFEHPFYPYSGADTDTKHILNVPLPAGADGAYFREKVASVWFEPLKQFKPQMIFFSAGFDAFYRDPMANIALKEDDYAWITREIVQIAQTVCPNRVISLLEGGYDLTHLGSLVAAHVAQFP